MKRGERRNREEKSPKENERTMAKSGNPKECGKRKTQANKIGEPLDVKISSSRSKGIKNKQGARRSRRSAGTATYRWSACIQG